MPQSASHLIIIGYVWPEPDSSAAGQNMMNIINAFQSAGWQITFLTAATDSPHKADLSALGIATEPAALNSSSFNHRIAQLAPDAVLFDRYMTEEQFSWRVREVCPEAVRILNTEDLHSLRDARHQAVKAGRPPEQADRNTALAQREVAAILRSDITLVISPVELALLTSYYQVPQQQLCHLPLRLPLPDINTLPGFNARSGFVSIGNFRHAPNWDAVLQLRQHLWPAIRARLPKAQLQVYGAYPPKKATQLHSPKEGFFVAGWAEDAAEVVRNARVLLAPLRFGAGLKGKLILAMASGTPSVTTEIGAEGICEDGEWPGACSSDIIAMADASYQLHEDATQFTSAQQRGLSIATRFADPAPTQDMVQRVKALANDIDTHRASLFLQHLLWHQSLSSTRYMSQWIEAKNRLPEP